MTVQVPWAWVGDPQVERFLKRQASYASSKAHWYSFEDALQDAYVLTESAWQSWDPRGGSAFLTWVWYYVKKGLTRRLKRLAPIPLPQKYDPQDPAVARVLEGTWVPTDTDPDVLGTIDPPDTDSMALRHITTAVMDLPLEQACAVLDWTEGKHSGNKARAWARRARGFAAIREAMGVRDLGQTGE